MVTKQKKTADPSETFDHIQAHLQKAHRICVCVAAEDVAAAFHQMPRLQEEIDLLKQTLEDRKVIEQAKGVLMRRSCLTEQEAHGTLQKHSTQRSIKIAALATLIVNADMMMEEVLNGSTRR